MRGSVSWEDLDGQERLEGLEVLPFPPVLPLLPFLEPQLGADADQPRLQNRQRGSAGVRRRRQERRHGRRERGPFAQDRTRVRRVEQIDLRLSSYAVELERPAHAEIELAVVGLVSRAR